MIWKTRTNSPARAARLMTTGVTIFLSAPLLGPAAAVAQDAVLWRVEDGGNGHWYAVLDFGDLGWDGSKTAAESVGGHLATLTSAEESAFVGDIELTNRGIHLGGIQDASGPEPDGGWAWITGEAWDYTNWNEGEPNNGNGLEDRLYFSNTGLFGDKWGDGDNYCEPCLAHLTAVEWSADCNNDGIVDYGQILDGTFPDKNQNGVPDPCDQPGGFDGILDVPAEYSTIQAAIDAAPNGSHILVQPGTYTGSSRWVVSIEDKSLTLESVAGPDLTIIEGEMTRCGVRIWGPAATGTVVRGFTLRHCLADERSEGEAVLVLRGTLDALVEDCHLVSNQGAAISAGGLQPFDNTPTGTIQNCRVQGNTSNDSWLHDAMIGVSYGQPRFDSCIFKENNDTSIFLAYWASPTLQNCRFIDNDARATAVYGGIIASDGSMVDIDNCWLESNSSADGCEIAGSGISIRDTSICVAMNEEDGICADWNDLGGNTIGCCTPNDCYGEGVQWRVEDGGNGHWYLGVRQESMVTWDESRLLSISLGGHLVTITTGAEDAWIKANTLPQLDPGYQESGPYIGGMRDDDTSAWRWVTGEEWNYDGWCTGEPTPAENFANYYNWQQVCWNNTFGDSPDIHTFIVEWSADCNNDGVVDYGQVLDGTATDCDGNFVPDECDLNDIASLSESRTPASVADFIEFDVSAMSEAADVVTLEVSAVGDLATTSEFMFVYLDGAQIGLAFVADGASCLPVTNTFSIPAADWNAAGADGSRLVRISGVNIAPDACSEPSTSIRVVVPQPIVDCDANGVWDACDISAGDASDLDGNGVPDSCDPDCDGDGEPDGYEIASGQDLDCNGNLVPDACDLADGGSSNDVDSDGVPDECQPDCDADGLPDSWELAEGLAMDCNDNGHPDNCDIAEGTSNDVDSNGTPDECKDDCNGNGIPDYWEILKGQVEDCDGNGIPDPCDISAGTLADCDLDGRWDECAIDDGSVTDCNDNRVPDACDIEGGTDEDDNSNGTPDACEIALGDLNLDGCIDSGDLGLLIALWGIQNPPFGDLNGDGVIAAADLGLLIGNWTPCP